MDYAIETSDQTLKITILADAYFSNRTAFKASRSLLSPELNSCTIDLGKINTIGSEGIGKLLLLLAAAKKHELDYSLSNAHGDVKEVMDLDPAMVNVPEPEDK